MVEPWAMSQGTEDMEQRRRRKEAHIAHRTSVIISS
jgi:hypothetical protein